MYREPSKHQEGTEPPRRQKKIQEIQPCSLETEQIRKEEEKPWILEKDDETISFTGKLEGAQKSRYIIMVGGLDGFNVYPLQRWYRFTKKTTRTQVARSQRTFFEELSEPKRMKKFEEEEVDYEDIFDDDDENEYVEASEEEEELTKEGREMKTLLKIMEGNSEENTEEEPVEEKREIIITAKEILEKLGNETHRLDAFFGFFKERLNGDEERKEAFKNTLKEVADFVSISGVTHLTKKR